MTGHARRPRPAALLALLFCVALLAVACSDGGGSATTGGGDGEMNRAAGASDSVDIDEFCSTFSRAGFLTAAELATCFILENRTTRFSAPGRLDSRFELFVPKAECGTASDKDGFKCVDTPKRFGEIRDRQNGSTYGARFPNPNPFLDVAAVQFQSAAMYAGTEELVYVGSRQSPLSLNQIPAKAFFSKPYLADAYGDCRGNGQFLACEIVANSWAPNGDWQRPRYIFRTWPMLITISNRSGKTAKLASQPVVGDGLLLDPNGTSPDLSTIESGKDAVIGGYRSTNNSGEQAWSGTYKLTTLSGDITVKITVKLALVDGKWENESTCVVTNPPGGTVTYKCDKPVISPSDALREATVVIKDFSNAPRRDRSMRPRAPR